jgi:hypothetical protein
MKAVSLFIAATAAVSVGAWGQGQFLFTNYAPPDIDARFRWGIEPPGFSIYGPGARVEFWTGWAGTPSSGLQRLDVTTDFRTDNPSEWGYVNPVVVTVPGVPPGKPATFMAQVFRAGASLPSFAVTLTLTLGGGGIPVPTAPLNSLPPWHDCPDCHGDPPFVGFQQLPNQTLIWWSKGALQQAESLEGPWTTITNWSNPYLIRQPAEGPPQKFFRVKL